jgi:acetylornithine deacetylase/succinyl-diaminopimelate desuccinylase-like protein
MEEGGTVVPLSDAKGKIQGEWRLYARSSSDEKAAIMCMVVALDALKAIGIPPSINIVFLFEGEEEIGSPHMSALLDKYKEILKADGLLLCGGPVHSSRRMIVYFGARGGLNLNLTVYGANRHLHSGHYGNWAPNPVALLAHLISSMRDTDGKILIDRFYDDVRPITETEGHALKEVPEELDAALRKELDLAWSECQNAPLVERIMLPAFNLGSLHAGPTTGAASIPSEARLSIGFRLVPDQTPEKVKSLVEDHIRKQGYHIVHETPDKGTRLKHSKIVKLKWEEKGSLPVRTSMDLPFSQSLIHVLEDATGGSLIKLPSIGSVAPMELFKNKLHVPVIILPVVNHDNNQHGPNENVRIQNLWDGIEIYASLFARLGESWK